MVRQSIAKIGKIDVVFAIDMNELLERQMYVMLINGTR